MAISRPFLVALVAALLLALAAFAWQRARTAKTQESAPTAAPTSPATPPQQTKPAPARRSGADALDPNARVLQRALRERRTSVLFFHQRGGLDDRATAEAVDRVERAGGVLVLRDDVRDADRYGRLVERLGVSQAPALVLVDRDGSARLLEGYVDPETLTQELADLR